MKFSVTLLPLFSRRPWLLALLVFATVALPMAWFERQWQREAARRDQERLNGFAQDIKAALVTDTMHHQRLLQIWRERLKSASALDEAKWWYDVDDETQLKHSRFRSIGVAVWSGDKLKVQLSIAGRDDAPLALGTDLTTLAPISAALKAEPKLMKGLVSSTAAFDIPPQGRRVMMLTSLERSNHERCVIFALLVTEDFLEPAETVLRRINTDGSAGEPSVMKKFLPYVSEGVVTVRLASQDEYHQAQSIEALNTTFTLTGPTGSLRLLFLPGPKFRDGNVELQGNLVLTGGLAIAAMLAALAWTQARQRAVLAAEVDARTADLKTTRDELRAALDNERELVRMKSQFVNTVSHEFRTPLGVILSSADILAHYLDRLSPDLRAQHLRDIQDSSQQMSLMLEQVLDLGRIESGKSGCQHGLIALTPLLQRLADESHSASGTNVRLLVEGDLSNAQADESLLRHILLNLLSNACKYSSAAALIEFTAQRDGEDAVFIVRDHGIGIPAHEVAQMFESFTRASNVADTPGTGLGLAIVQRCVVLHGGTIRLDSIEGKGTTVTVRLPLFGASS